MSDSLASLLQNRLPDEPPEFAPIRQYIKKQFGITPTLSVNRSNIVITVPSASLAGSLRLQLFDLEQYCKTERKLVIRIGQ